MKKTWIFCLLLGITVLMLALALWLKAPHSLYRFLVWGESSVIPWEVYSGWPHLKGRGHALKDYLVPGVLQESSKEDESFNQVGQWVKLHFQDVYLPLPYKHPFYLISPLLEWNASTQSSLLGWQFFSPDEKLLMSFQGLPEEMLELKAEHSFFALPLVDAYLQKKSPSLVWYDFFHLNLEQAPESFEEVCYFLYLLELRIRLLPQDFVRFGAVETASKHPLMYISLFSKDKNFEQQVIKTLSGSMVKSYALSLRSKASEALLLRLKFWKEIQYLPSDQEEALRLYREFKSLSFDKQMDQEGLIYLYSAWSHRTEQQGFLEELIRLQERGPHYSEMMLKPVYDYALSRYGSNFSEREDFKKETPELRIKRKTLEEDQAILAVKKEQQRLEREKSFGETAQEKMERLLKAAKEENQKKNDEKKIKID